MNIFTLLLAVLIPVVSGDLASFTSCVPSQVELHFPSSGSYKNLADLNFRTEVEKPVAIALPADESQVQEVVRCAGSNDLKLCVRSGGHSLVGNSLCTGLLLDVGKLRSVSLKNNVASIGAGVTMGELLWAIWNKGRKWVAAGVCPGVGVGGYVFGGGHGPYEGRLGMICDSLVSVRLVTKDGEMVTATKSSNSDLFWALCGAGGGQLGVVTEFELKTVDSKPFDNAVVFRFVWPHDRIGELMEKWAQYGEEGGDVWFRMEMYLEKSESGMTGYGACYNVGSVSECTEKLERADFFATPGRVTLVLEKVESALDAHAFFGPDGDWGRKIAPDTQKALMDKRYHYKGVANGRKYQSTFLTFQGGWPGKNFWQGYADYCARPGKWSIPWVVCELNLFNNAIDLQKDNAFAHRGAHVITHYIIGGGEESEKIEMYKWMKEYLKPHTTGVYVNYPELELGNEEYPRKYWGKSLDRLKKIKGQYDPDLFFLHPQPIPTA